MSFVAFQVPEMVGKPSPVLKRVEKTDVMMGRQGVELGMGSPTASWGIKASTPRPTPSTASRIAKKYPPTPGTLV